MNPLFHIVKYVGFTLLGIVTKKSWDWLTKDVDPIPGTKEFAKEYRETQSKLENKASTFQCLKYHHSKRTERKFIFICFLK